MIRSFGTAAVMIGLFFAGSATGTAQTQEPVTAAPMADIYDPAADGAKQIEAALHIARRDNKRVLLVFGANWCSWCQKLHALFKSDRSIARTLLYEYVVVPIDVDRPPDKPRRNEAVNQKYGNPIQFGLPALVVLDADGKQLTTQDTGKLEDGDHHDPARVQAFLDQWKPEPQKAETVLAAGMKKAGEQSRNVLLYFSAPWCGWCHKMTDWLERPEVAALIGKAYVPVKIDVDRMIGGKDMDTRFRGTGIEGNRGGIPFFVILDADGNVLGDSVGPKGNVGFPTQPEEIEHFIRLAKETGRQLTPADLEALKKSLTPPPSVAPSAPGK